MHQHIKHLRSCDDLLLVIASSDGKLQPSSTKKRSNTYAKNEVGLTKGSPPVNLCGRHMQNPAIRSTPTLMPNTPTNEDNENPWENIFEKPQSCMDKFMRGIKQNFQATYGDQNSPKFFNPNQRMLVDYVRKQPIHKKQRFADQCCTAKHKGPTFECTSPRLRTKPSCGRLSKMGRQCSSTALPKEFEMYFNKMIGKFKKFCCKQAQLPQFKNCLHSPKKRKRTSFHPVSDDGTKPIPSHMGWDYMINRKETGAGWRPGAIPKNIRKLMYYFLDSYPGETNPVSKSRRQQSHPKSLPKEPIIQLHRHNDAYTVTLNPVDINDHLAKPPITFTISATVEQQQMAKIKEVLLYNGFRYCNCGRSLARCQCRSQRELNELYAFVKQIERKYRTYNVIHRLCFEKSKDSYIEFTPANIAESMVNKGPNERLESVQQRGDTNQRENNNKTIGNMDNLTTFSKKKRKMRNQGTATLTRSDGDSSTSIESITHDSTTLTHRNPADTQNTQIHEIVNDPTPSESSKNYIRGNSQKTQEVSKTKSTKEQESSKSTIHEEFLQKNDHTANKSITSSSGNNAKRSGLNKKETLQNVNPTGKSSSNESEKEYMRKLIEQDLKDHRIGVRTNCDLDIDFDDDAGKVNSKKTAKVKTNNSIAEIDIDTRIEGYIPKDQDLFNFDINMEECKCVTQRSTPNKMQSNYSSKNNSNVFVQNNKGSRLPDNELLATVNLILDECTCVIPTTVRQRISNQGQTDVGMNKTTIHSNNPRLPGEKREETGSRTSPSSKSVNKIPRMINDQSYLGSERSDRDHKSVDKIVSKINDRSIIHEDQDEDEQTAIVPKFQQQKAYNENSYPISNKEHRYSETTLSQTSILAGNTQQSKSGDSQHEHPISNQGDQNSKRSNSQNSVLASNHQKYKSGDSHRKSRHSSSLTHHHEPEKEIRMLSYQGSHKKTDKEHIRRSDQGPHKLMSKKPAYVPRRVNVTHGHSQYNAKDYKIRKGLHRHSRQNQSGVHFNITDEDGMEGGKNGGKFGNQSEIDGTTTLNDGETNGKTNGETNGEKSGTKNSKNGKGRRKKSGKSSSGGRGGLKRKSSIVRLIHVGQQAPKVRCCNPCHYHYACQEYCAGVDVCQGSLPHCDFSCFQPDSYPNCNLWL